VRNLAGEIAHEWARRQEADGAPLESPRIPALTRPAGDSATLNDLLPLVQQIVPFHMRHNAEPEAVDLLLELDQLDLLPPLVDKATVGRTALYLLSCAPYLGEPEGGLAARAAGGLYLQTGRLAEALRVALKLGLATPHGARLAADCVAAAQAAPAPGATLRQLCYQLARSGALGSAEGPLADALAAARGALGGEEEEAVGEILGSCRLSEQYLALARDLDVVEAKTPEDVYKTHLAEGRAPSGAAAVDSARANLAATFVNAFVNAGFGHDKLLTKPGDEASEVSWIYKNKDHGKMAAAASLGCITLWDVEGGLSLIDKYTHAADPQVVAGALLAIGINTCGVRTEVDPAFALLHEHTAKDAKEVRCGAALGLGLAYAGAQRREVADLLAPIVVDEANGMEVAGCAALALGLAFVGTADEDCVQALLTCLMCRSQTDLKQPFARLTCLALGLLFLGRGSAADATAEVLKTLHPGIARFAAATLDGCAYAGTGDVLKVQQLLQIAGEHDEPPAAAVEGPADAAAPAAPAAAAASSAPEESWKSEHQAAAVLGVALVALGEDVGSDMALRSLEHLLLYGDAVQRKAVPLAMALLSASKPALGVTEALSRLAHDPAEATHLAALLGLGLAAAGTNNARVATQLRQLASYYHKEPQALFMARVSQGLVHLGKGLLTLHPLHSDRQLLHLPALAGLLCACWSALDAKETLLGRFPSLLYLLTPAMQPRMLHTVDDKGAPLAVPVRVGEAVDTVAQAGRPKTITGFQTHTSPVLLAVGERAELGTEQYIACSPLLEGVVVLRQNPEYSANV